MEDIHINSNSLALTRLLQLTAPTLPVGAYAYSQGLESAVEVGYLGDVGAAGEWITGILTEGICRTDLPMLLRMFNAWRAGDDNQLQAANEELLALRETRELWQEDLQMGRALARLLDSLEVTGKGLIKGPSFVSQFARAGAYWDIEEHDLLTGFAWSWLENQVSVATKLVPLGQTEAQALLMQISAEIPLLVTGVQESVQADHAPGQSLPGLAILSCQHEVQESRLFRS